MKISHSPSKGQSLPAKTGTKSSSESAQKTGFPDKTAPASQLVGQTPKASLSPLFRLISDFWEISSSEEGFLMTERLAKLPPEERKEALFLHILLSKRKVSLKEGEWEELWKKLKTEGGDPRKLLDTFRSSGEESALIGEESYFRLFNDDKGKGSLLITLESDRVQKLSFCLERGGRKWEFHMSRPQKDRSRGSMVVYTDDENLVRRAPPGWKEFRQSLKPFGIEVEKCIKTIQADPFFSDKSNREPDRLVDIVL